jgi:hypothetical protein
MPDPEYTVKIVKGKAVYTKVESKPVGPKVNKSLGCRARYNSYAKAQSLRTGATIDFDTWAGINCQG